MRYMRYSAILLALLILTGCGLTSKETSDVIMESPAPGAEGIATKSQLSRKNSDNINLESSKETNYDQSADDNPKYPKKIIKTGTLEFETYDIDKTRNHIIKVVKANDAYISYDHQRKNEDRIIQRVVIRVPAEKFNNLVREISNNIDNLDSRNISVKDVTEQFIDLETRLNTKKKLEKRYLDLLERAGNVKDILEIEREVGKLREIIESTERRLKYLQNQVSLSTLTIKFYYRTASLKILSLRKMKSAFVNGWNNFLEFLIGALNIWPFIIIIVIVFFLIRRMRRNKRELKRQEKTT